MPKMTGVELLKSVYERFPATVRIILTGFADAEATVKAINDGHIYGYVNKPWEPEELKTIVRRAVELHDLTMLNGRLVDELRDANLFLAAVMDKLRTGAIAVDRDGVVRAVNQPARAFLGLGEDVTGKSIASVMKTKGLEELAATVRALEEDAGGTFEEVDLPVGPGHRVRISSQAMTDESGAQMGRVVMFKEISHEPLTRRLEEIVDRLMDVEGPLRAELEAAQNSLAELAGRVAAAGVESANMAELAQRVSRTQTAIGNWLDVDDAMANEEYPDVAMLQNRLALASKRWPRSDALPKKVVELARSVESYYESGENPRERIL
jgi:PAS domain S-box-containing protein